MNMASHIQKKLGQVICSKVFFLLDSDIKNSTTEPPTAEKLLYNLYYCKRPHFISFHFYWHRRTDRDAPTRLQLQLCNMQFHTQFTVTKSPWTHQMLPQCSTDRPEAGGGGSCTTEWAHDLMTTLGSLSLPRPAWSFRKHKPQRAASLSLSVSHQHCQDNTRKAKWQLSCISD